MNLYITILLEFLLICSSILLLFKFRAKIGLAPLYILLGAMQYLQANLGSSFSVNLFGDYIIYPGSIILFSAVLFAVLLIYIKEGVASARALIIGIVISNFIMTLMFEITYFQQVINSQIDNTSLNLDSVFNVNYKYFINGTAILFLDFLFMILIYQYLISKVKNLHYLLILFISLLSILIFDAIAFNVVLFYGTPLFKTSLISHVFGKSLAALVFSIILYFYVKYLERGTSVTATFIATQDRDVFSILKYRERYINLKAEKVQVEKKLTSQIESTLNNISDGFVSLDTNWRYTYINKRAAEFLGRTPESLIGKHIWTEFPEGVGLPFYKAYYKAVDTQKTIYFEDYYEPFDKWFENRIYPSSEGLTIYFTDITEQKKADTNNQMLLSLIETSDDFVGLSTLEGKPIYLNANGRKIVGLAANEELSGSIADFFPEKYKDIIVNEHMPNIFKNNKWNGEVEFKNFKTGAVILIEMSGFLINDSTINKPIALGIVATDITKRKEANEKLRNSENYIRTILETEPECIKQLNSKGELIYMNPAGLAMIEADNLDMVKDQSVVDLISPNHQYAFKKLISNVFKGNSGELEFQMTGLKGTNRWLETHAVPFKNNDGSIISLLGVTRDITDRKLAEEDIIKSKKYLENIINNIGDPVFVKDEDSKFLLVNDAFYSIFNLSEEDVLGKTLAENLPAEQMEGFLINDKHVLSTGIESINEETLTVQGKGEYFVSTKKTRYIDDSGNKYLIGVFRDITERKKREEEIRVAHQRITTHLNNSPLAIIEWDENLVIRNWSEQAKNIFGWEATEAEGKHFNDLNLVYEEDVAATSVIGDELMHGKVKSNRIINRNYTKTNKIIYCEWYNSVLQSPDGQIETVFSLVQDITEQKNVERELKENEEKFSKAFESNVIGKAILNNEKKIIEVNEALANIVGFKRENMLGKTAEEIGLFNFNDQNNLDNEKLLWSEFGKTGSVSNIELNYQMQEGRDLFLLISLRALQLNNEDHVLITILDITEKKNAAAELEKHRNNLEELVKIRTEEVNLKNNELQRINKLFVGRELRMKELKRIIKELQSKFEN